MTVSLPCSTEPLQIFLFIHLPAHPMHIHSSAFLCKPSLLLLSHHRLPHTHRITYPLFLSPLQIPSLQHVATAPRSTSSSFQTPKCRTGPSDNLSQKASAGSPSLPLHPSMPSTPKMSMSVPITSFLLCISGLTSASSKSYAHLLTFAPFGPNDLISPCIFSHTSFEMPI